jgi:hypothetical protein
VLFNLFACTFRLSHHSHRYVVVGGRGGCGGGGLFILLHVPRKVRFWMKLLLVLLFVHYDVVMCDAVSCRVVFVVCNTMLLFFVLCCCTVFGVGVGSGWVGSHRVASSRVASFVCFCLFVVILVVV